MKGAIEIIEKLVEDNFDVSIDINPQWHVESKSYKPFARVTIEKGVHRLARTESFNVSKAVRHAAENAREELRKIYVGRR